MANRLPEVDAYIAKAAPFAQPILKSVRAWFHKAHPQIEEVMKWNFPHFEYKGLVGSMAAFKQHASFGFWKASLLRDPKQLLGGVGNTSMGGIKVSSVDELPSEKIMLEYIREAVELNENGVKAPNLKKLKKDLEVPTYFLLALKKNKKALATFEGFSPSHKREYVEWITEARQEATRDKRLATAIEWLAEGKSRNWKYANC